MSITACLFRATSPALRADQRDRIVDLCLEAIEMAPSLPGDHVGRAARTGALILLDLAYPELDLEQRSELARTCEVLALTAA